MNMKNIITLLCIIAMCGCIGPDPDRAYRVEQLDANGEVIYTCIEAYDVHVSDSRVYFRCGSKEAARELIIGTVRIKQQRP